MFSLHRLLFLPHLRGFSIRFDINFHEDYSPLEDFGLSFLRLARTCVKLKEKLNTDMVVGNPSIGSELTQFHSFDVDLTWILHPLTRLSDGDCSLLEEDFSLRQLIPSQLVTMSVFRYEFAERDISEDIVVQRILMTAVLKDTEAQAIEKRDLEVKEEAGEVGSTGRLTNQKDWVHSRFWFAGANEARYELHQQQYWLRDDESLLPNYPLVTETHRWT